MRTIDRVLVLIPLGAAIVVIATWLVPGLDGPYAILTILSPHLAIGALLIAAILAVVRGRTVRLGLLALVVVVAARFGGEWLSLPSTAGPAAFTIATWNMEWTDIDGREAIDGLAHLQTDVVALQELTPDQAAAIEASADVTARYPYRRLEPGSSASGIGLLSRRPLTHVEHAADPVTLQATLGGEGAPITIIAAHPYGPRIGVRRARYDASGRDERLTAVRAQLDAAAAGGEPVILIGDFNVSPTEAGFRELTAGLHDAHAEVGEGPGWTWRPDILGTLPVGVLRIDLVLSTPPLIPVSSRVACPTVGDHCQVIAGFVSPR